MGLWVGVASDGISAHMLSDDDFYNIYLKVKGYTLKGSNPSIFILTFLLNRDLLLKERICS